MCVLSADSAGLVVEAGAFLQRRRGVARGGGHAPPGEAGRADRELVQRAVQFGVNNYLVKPFTVQQLKDKLEAVFGPLT